MLKCFYSYRLFYIVDKDLAVPGVSGARGLRYGLGAQVTHLVVDHYLYPHLRDIIDKVLDDPMGAFFPLFLPEPPAVRYRHAWKTRNLLQSPGHGGQLELLYYRLDFLH